jgi:hypothetical protein
MMKNKERFGHIQKAEGKKVVLKPPKELKESAKPDKPEEDKPKRTKEERDKRIAEIDKKQAERKAKKDESKKVEPKSRGRTEKRGTNTTRPYSEKSPGPRPKSQAAVKQPRTEDEDDTELRLKRPKDEKVNFLKRPFHSLPLTPMDTAKSPILKELRDKQIVGSNDAYHELKKSLRGAYSYPEKGVKSIDKARKKLFEIVKAWEKKIKFNPDQFTKYGDSRSYLYERDYTQKRWDELGKIFARMWPVNLIPKYIHKKDKMSKEQFWNWINDQPNINTVEQGIELLKKM